MGDIKISVTTVTSRDLGIFPYQVAALKSQTFQDFEWVFVDDIWEERKERFKKEVGDAFPLTHIPPNQIVPYFAPGVAYNDCFVHCKGELIFFMADYIVPHVDCLKTIWETHQKHPNAMLSGRCWEIDISAQEFHQPNKTFHYNDYRLSLYENSYFRWTRLNESLYMSEPMGVQNFWTGRNDACPLEPILQCNGFDEQFDGAHGYHDEDLAQRLRILGLDYVFNLQSLCFQFSHQLCGKPSLRTDLEQHILCKTKLIPQRLENKIFSVNPDRNLRKEREKCLKP